MGINFLFFECGGWHFVVTPFTKDDCFRTFLSSCSRKFKLIQARALASSNLSRLLLSQAQTYPGPSSSQKRKTLLSLNFLFRNIFVQLEKLSALPIYFLIFDESVKFSNFFFTRMQEIQFFIFDQFFSVRDLFWREVFRQTARVAKIGAREWFIICWFFSFFRLSLDFH